MSNNIKEIIINMACSGSDSLSDAGKLKEIGKIIKGK